MQLDKDGWLRSLRDEFAACDSPVSILEGASHLWALRHFEDVMTHGADSWRYVARKLLAPQRLVVGVDLGELFHAAYHVKGTDSPPLCLQMLRGLWSELKPSHLIVAADTKCTWRRDLCPDYKCKRKPDPEKDATEGRCIEYLRQHGVPVFREDQMESDDILSSLAFRCQLLKFPVVIVSVDRDMWQCLGPGTALYDRKKQQYLSGQELHAKHGIWPKQAVDWLTLVGKNDVDGVPGVGASTASKYLEAYGNFYGICDHLDALPQKHQGSFNNFMEMYSAKRQVHQLSREARVSLPGI